MNYKEYIVDMPKVQLHCHLDGSVRPSTILEICKNEGIELPSYDLEELTNELIIKDKCESLKEYLKRFVLPCKVMQTKENIYRITMEFLEDCKKDNLSYVEIRFAPYLHTEKGLSISEVIETVLEAKEDAFKKFNIQSNIIACFLRHVSEDVNLKALEEFKKFKDKGIVALDLAGNEQDFPPEQFQRLFKKVKEYGFNVTIHAGETGREQNIVTAVNSLGAKRIGHGVSAFKDENVEKFLIEKDIPLEICVTSNYNTNIVDSFKDHPVKDFLNKGIKVTLNTDNNTVSNIKLSEEIIKLYEQNNFSIEDINKCMIYSIESSFCCDGLKKDLEAELNNFYKKNKSLI